MVYPLAWNTQCVGLLAYLLEGAMEGASLVVVVVLAEYIGIFG